MEFDGSAFEFKIYFSSCDTFVPFKNPSDAAIARLSAQKGVTLAAVQAVLDLIVFNPSFNSREVTFTSAGSIDEVVMEYKQMQVLQRVSVGDEEVGSRNGATSPLAISLVVSQLKQDMVPSSWLGNITWWNLDFKSLLRKMSLVHRSWTMPAQELLFQRVFGTDRSDLVRRLIQHPFCSGIRELHFTVGCMSYDDLDRFALLLRRIPSLLRLSLSVSKVNGFTLADRDDICNKIYSNIAPCLPNLVGLWIQHNDTSLLGDCVKCLLQRGSGAAPFILKDFAISCDYGDFESEMLLSPAHLHPIVHHKTPRYPSTCGGPQVPNSKDISKCSITLGCRHEQGLGRPLALLFGTGGVFGDIHPQINHLTLYHWRSSLPDDTAFGSFLVSFLGRCISLTRMNVFIDKYISQEMSVVPFSSISKSLQVLSIYYSSPVDSDAQGRAFGLERVVRIMRDRESGSSLKRIEVTFCRDLDMVDRQALPHESVEMAPPEYLDPVRRMCHELDIDLICKIVE